MKTNRLLLVVALLAAFATVGSSQEIKKVEKDGYIWYQTSTYLNGMSYEGALDENRKTIIPANKYQNISYFEIKDQTTNRVTGHYFCATIIKDDLVIDGIIMPDGTVAYEPNRKYNAVSINSAFDGNLFYIYPHQIEVGLKKKELELFLKDPATGKYKRIANEKTGEYGFASCHEDGYLYVVIDDDHTKYYDLFGDFLCESKYLYCQKDKVTDDNANDGKVILNTSLAEYNVKKCAEKYAKYKKSNSTAAMTYCRIAAFFINEVNPILVKDAEFIAKIASLMEKGDGVPSNTKKAKELYAQAEKAGYAPAGGMLKALNDKEKPIAIKGDLPQGVKDVDLYFLSEAELLDYAQQGYLIPIREYCRQQLIFVYGNMWYNEAENKVVVDKETTKQITDNVADEVVRLLEAGATKDASCQFMLACLYSGMKCLNMDTDTKAFTYTDYGKAKSYLSKFQANPNRKDADCFGQSQIVVEWISNNIKKL